MPNVAISAGCHEYGLQLLRDAGMKLTVIDDSSEKSKITSIKDAEAILVRTTLLPECVLRNAENLRIVSRHGVGFDNVDVAYLSSRGIPMALAVDSNVTSVAEHTLMLMLVIAKDCFRADREQRQGNYAYRDKRTARDLRGSRVLIMGYGRIGRQVAALCSILGMQVTIYDPFISADQLDAGQTLVDEYRTVLPDMDIVTLHMPLTEKTRYCIGAAELASMKEGSILINCARGGLVDESALYESLKNQHLFGAGLDVFEQEPPSATCPLFSLDNVVVSPHNAALTEACAARMSGQAAQNIIDFFNGKLEARVVVNRREIGMQSA